MDRRVIDNILRLADSVNDFLPANAATQEAIDLARKVEDLLDHVKDKIPVDQQAQAQQTRAALAARVTAKSEALSSRLRGK
jgi:ElaB/YqjD/DUF883 family membrane-anchored ribosome-binding protein